ncbi:Xaa-Pro peptidase family protein [Pontibacterium granulatum]|uniref:M24 family metallopeptidase n=1 Tax=Pontibacterium granulatum TaxID=2036029 RepID=UPI00249CC845|nr:Xaa-Pro peptidase family protein [Pontibacterium granulatum]MDI3325781.1 Xaa-Pro peptidase family protein [Pontibacterium granulatum]
MNVLTDKKTYLNDVSRDAPLVNPVSDETLHRTQHYRLERVRQQLRENDYAAILLYDPVNIRYATDSSNMQIWTAHNASRYAMIFANGPVLLWEFHNCEHLASHLDTIDEIRLAVNWAYFGAGPRVSEKAEQWACEIADLMHQHGGGNKRLAVDKMEPEGVFCLQQKGFSLHQGQPVMEMARALKSDDELELMRWTINVCEHAMERMYQEQRAGMTENELWAYLHYENIRNGGEWIETRLLASGERTNPWMQESSNKVMQEGEMLGFDTDMIGPYGYCADISRTWTVGHARPTDEQRRLYATAYEQVHYNMDMIKPGMTFKEFTEKAWPIPEHFHKNRYCCVIHGIGMADEYPAVAHQGNDWASAGYDGVFHENMTVCVESYIGEEGGKEGVKVEEQVLITKDGCAPLSTFRWETEWL